MTFKGPFQPKLFHDSISQQTELCALLHQNRMWLVYVKSHC